jgi:hypothetical protein
LRIPKDLVPQKAVAQDLCVSLVTLWRARNSRLPGFPDPVVLRGMIFWRKSDLDKLEDALMKFDGRTKFEERRDHRNKVAALKKTTTRATRRRPPKPSADGQQDLF